ncbi:hypothetical protein [Lutibacter sp.]
MLFNNLKEQSNVSIGLLLILFFTLNSCTEKGKENSFKTKVSSIKYLTPIDSVDFVYKSPSWKGDSVNYYDNRYGYSLFLNMNNTFELVSINSNNELHRFNFKSNLHSYSKPICKNEILAFSIDSNYLSLLYNDTLYVKDFQLKNIDKFPFPKPNIQREHGIDFSIENNSNLFKINNYYVIMYYIVDEKGEYRSTKYLFYYFNKEEAFFSNKMCEELEKSFQYFRYPAIVTDNNFIYHAPRIMNCISKSNSSSTVKHNRIDEKKDGYLKLNPEDQYQISKLKKYRFTSFYNKCIMSSGENIYLLREFLYNSYFEKGVKKYNHDIELIVFNKNLEKQKSYFIKDNAYSFTFIKNNKLYFFNLNKNKYYSYEI